MNFIPENRPHQMSRLIFSLSIVIPILALLGIAVAEGRRWSANHDKSVLTVQNPNPLRTVIDSELLTLTPTGFEPASITRPKGKFLLAVDNRTGLEAISFELRRVNGASERQTRLTNHRVRWREIMDLPPGNYVIQVADHNWFCSLSISPN